IAVSAVPAAIAVSAIAAAVPAAIAAAVPAAIAAAVPTAIAAFAGIGLGHNDTIDGETERRDNKRQRSQRSQDQPAAPARCAHPAIPTPVLQPAMSQHKHPQSAHD
ncbi:hypothetical protein, partial [Mesorhizobium sp.]|uniref:hypothetical protein n=1 Tax=Mesorhizobium sp. TaxID=1871066 RepID=UPI0025EFEF20